MSTPNTLGRDLFLFYLGADGILYPAGGLDAAAFDHAAQGIDTVRGETWQGNGGNDSFACNTNHMGNGWGCTARVIEDGYRINY